MAGLIISIIKELRLLWRDRAGLLVLFVMPALLVIIISLVQMNVMKTFAESDTRILVIDQDRNEISRKVVAKLSAAGSGRVDAPAEMTKARAVAAVAQSDYPVCIIIPPHLTADMEQQARAMARQALDLPLDLPLNLPLELPPDTTDLPGTPLLLELYFDPLASGAFRAAMQQAMARVLLGVEVEARITALGELLPKKIASLLGPLAAQMGDSLPGFSISWPETTMVTIKSAAALRQGFNRLPTAIQQNVAAWSLFGIFFIVLPLSGTLIRERETHTLDRLQILPVSYLTLLSAKVIAYLVVCLLQFGLILIIGRYLMPLFGSPAFEIGHHGGAMIGIVGCAALAATSYGIMLGVLARTHNQAAMVGALSVVIASAIGGVMVPVFAMPGFMQDLSRISPLAWGLSAFLDVFVKGGGLAAIWPDMARLLIFAAVMLLIAWAAFYRRLFEN